MGKAAAHNNPITSAASKKRKKEWKVNKGAQGKE